MYDVIIIGSGPAGLTASIYTIRASLKTLVIAGYEPGGQLTKTTLVENFPGFPEGIAGPELMQRMRKQAQNLGVEFVDKRAVEVEVGKRPFKVYTEMPVMAISKRPDLQALRSGLFYQAHSLILATGASPQWLGVPGEKEFLGRGVSTCAPCDAFFFRGKDVAVVGGGDSALEEALVLAKVANSVTIIHRRDQFRASKIIQERVFNNPKIKVIWKTEVAEILGKEKVTGVKLKTDKKSNYSSSPSAALGVNSARSSRPAKRDSNNKYNVWNLPTDGVFIAIGHRPNSLLFKGKIDLDEKGYVLRVKSSEVKVKSYETMTSVEGVFVAGDVHDYKYRQAITAAGFGCMAAMDVERWLEEGKRYEVKV